MAITFRVENDLKECQKLWNFFSPKKSFADLWEVRNIFAKQSKYPPSFLVGNLNGEDIGFLPLLYEEYDNDQNDGYYVFWGGGDWLEEFTFYIKEEFKREYLKLFLANVPGQKVCLSFIDHQELVYLPELQPDEEIYFLDLEKYDYSLEKYFLSFSKKSRKNINNELKKIAALQPQVFFNRFADFEEMVKMNKKRFGEESLFSEDSFRLVFKSLLAEKSLKDKIRMVSLEIDGELKAATVNIFYNGVYTLLQSGNVEEINNIYKYLNVECIKDAIGLKAKEINYLADECGWKDHWRLEKRPTYFFDNV